MIGTRCIMLLLLMVAMVEAKNSNNNYYANDEEKELQERLYKAKLNLWSRGEYALDERTLFGTNLMDQVNGMEQYVMKRLGPIKRARYHHLASKEEEERMMDTVSSCWGLLNHDACNRQGHNNNNNILSWMRGGATTISTKEEEKEKNKNYQQELEEKIQELSQQFGPDFLKAIEQNKVDHENDCQVSCQSYYCANTTNINNDDDDNANQKNDTSTQIISYSMGAVPPEDFAMEFGFPLDLIKVTEGKPLFDAQEAKTVIENAEAEGVDKNEYKSGKYKLGGDWLTNLPQTRAWFNRRLETTLFPLVSRLFPEIISSPSVLRAHSVSLLKYNSSHPRTDVHVDNGILAMTLAMTPQSEYTGGGTFFEHFDEILPMNVGHGTFRPGSVRHGGHAVSGGTRYILGAFLLISDRVEHVRRLKNRGSQLRSSGDLRNAERHFEWALALNPKCTTCLKDWAEILHTRHDYVGAETKIRRVLELLEYKDSDALFTLGVLLSAQQDRDDEAIDAYYQSLQLNDQDAELLYNLGIKLGVRGDVKQEMQMYAKCTRVDPNFGGAWLNWGTALAESGNLDDAQLLFLKAMNCPNDDENNKNVGIRPKAMMNLALIYHSKTNALLQARDMVRATENVQQTAQYLDAARPLLQALQQQGNNNNNDNKDVSRYLAQYKPLRLACFRNMGQIHAGNGNWEASEAEFRKATETFPQEPAAWQLLGRVLELQGKTQEMQAVKNKLSQLLGAGGAR